MDTGRVVTFDFEDGRHRIVIDQQRMHSLPAVLAAATRQAGLQDFYGSCQITVEPCQLEPVGSGSEPERKPRRCPDDGACHHGCGDGPCFRVLSCSPLSASGWDDWPESVKREQLGKKSATAPAVRPSR